MKSITLCALSLVSTGLDAMGADVSIVGQVVDMMNIVITQDRQRPSIEKILKDHGFVNSKDHVDGVRFSPPGMAWNKVAKVEFSIDMQMALGSAFPVVKMSTVELASDDRIPLDLAPYCEYQLFEIRPHYPRLPMVLAFNCDGRIVIVENQLTSKDRHSYSVYFLEEPGIGDIEEVIARMFGVGQLVHRSTPRPPR